MTLITINNLSKTYVGKGFSVEALKNINFEIDEGQMIAIMGPSGSGKSTFLNILGLIDNATSGEYLIDGTNVADYSDKEKARLRNKMFGFVLQDFALVERYNVFENIKIPLVYSDVEKSQWKNKINQVLKEVGIEEKKKVLPSQLSGGQRQRVAIARALVNDTSFILADEPTGALDNKTSDEIMKLLKTVRDKGTSIVLVTHDHHVASQCDKIYKISDGNLTINSHSIDS